MSGIKDTGVFARVKADRDAEAQEKHLDVAIPGFEASGLYIRVRPTEYKRTLDLVTRAQRAGTDPAKLVAATIDLIIAATEQLMIETADGVLAPFGDVIALDPDVPEEIRSRYGADSAPASWDPRLADLFGINAVEDGKGFRVRRVVSGLIVQGVGQESKIVSLGNEIISWIAGVNSDASQAAVANRLGAEDDDEYDE